MRKTNLLGVALSASAIWACASIAGISDAELDPTTLEGGRAGTGGSAGQAGTPAGGNQAQAGGGGGSLGEGGSAGASEAGRGGDAGSGGAPGDELCPEYCEVVMRNCPAALRVYETEAVCLRVCAALPPGERGEESGNTVACRLHHARLIETIGEAATQCPVAGPGGDNVCGSNCEGYCTLIQGICPPEFGLECESACGALTDLGGYSISQDKGDHVQCRLYHVSAATFGQATHCPHAAGEPPCAPPL